MRRYRCRHVRLSQLHRQSRQRAENTFDLIATCFSQQLSHLFSRLLLFSPLYQLYNRRREPAWEFPSHFHPKVPVLSADSLSPELLSAFHSVYQLPYQSDLRVHRALLQLIMAYLFPRIQLVENTDAGGTLLISRILEYLHGHFMEPVTLDTLARELHVNKFYLSHTFSNTLHMGFSAYLNKLRAERAMMLLRTTDQSIETIGAVVDFGTQRTFDRVFKKMTSLTPREYRQKYLTSDSIDNAGMPGKVLAYTEERYS